MSDPSALSNLPGGHEEVSQATPVQISEEHVYEALRDVLDPELGVNVVDLGLIYGVKIDGGDVEVSMTLTTPGCPMHRIIGQWVGQAVDALPGVENVTVRFVWEPRWTPDRLSAEAKKQLGFS